MLVFMHILEKDDSSGNRVLWYAFESVLFSLEYRDILHILVRGDTLSKSGIFTLLNCYQ